ncbi:MAG TPA: prepilin-type N-terminal cleavage/methylation domain-containing protein [Candidatus Sumerlaeota bacterium]|nr:MAG: Type II secretion system protein G precursor [candidate division BRC1 bacterium ADurb.BinA292]HOE96912.1 prepilin-type N-terminal cleavage/methylation domain-containing protein [Candidatus Sumerlaeota bacterium]HOR27721.1 prepilin-type N-terminal cleavage/methylation domain-containing protein [Candidatus Sumerlaeota bacterium]HPK02434.1 prepilin-type N-terminal cleavage/methylation domain-containing protein [Candidatus Sumerlaeota bacterium]
MKQHGFTLIELLIVVAIIAILAAIAVPNFLEAQVRSKVSRVHADMRTLATGLEAYRVDNNTLPAWFDPGAAYLPISAGVVLSTPVAYLTNPRMVDPFASQQNLQSWTLAGGIPFLQIFTNDDSSALRTIEIDTLMRQAATNPTVLPRCFPLKNYIIISSGPDHVDNTVGGYAPYAPADPLGSGVYDPTNGTVSNGDIFRMHNGRIPRGYIEPLDSTRTMRLTDPYL